MKRNIFVFDVESTSLHGKGFAVGVIVVDCATHKEVDSFELKSLEAEKGCSDWVKENVLPHLQEMPSVETDKELRDQFWDFYIKHKDTSYIWSDVAYPVETNFLESIFNDDREKREFEMPYPLLDVSSHVNVNIDRNEFTNIKGLRKHHPFDDAKASAYSLLIQLQGK